MKHDKIIKKHQLQCSLYKPCFNETCVNTVPGYKCENCPWGYSGSFEDGQSRTFKQRVFESCNSEHADVQQQQCSDINECLTNNGGCDPNAQCINTIGSYRCGFCNPGFLGHGRYGCYSDNYCGSGKHDCDVNAICIYTGPAQYRCEVRIFKKEIEDNFSLKERKKQYIHFLFICL